MRPASRVSRAGDTWHTHDTRRVPMPSCLRASSLKRPTGPPQTRTPRHRLRAHIVPSAKRPSTGRALRCAYRITDRPNKDPGRRDNASSTASRPSKGASTRLPAAQCVRLCALRTRRRCFVFRILLISLAVILGILTASIVPSLRASRREEEAAAKKAGRPLPRQRDASPRNQSARRRVPTCGATRSVIATSVAKRTSCDRRGDSGVISIDPARASHGGTCR